MIPVAIFTFIFLFQEVVAENPRDVLRYFKDCDLKRIKTDAIGWSSVLPEEKFRNDRDKDEFKSHCEERIQASRDVIIELEGCLSEEMKEGIPEFEQLTLNLMEDLCNNDTIMKMTLNEEVETVVSEKIFHDCFQAVNIKIDQMMEEDTIDAMIPRFCCWWSTAWQCYDQSLQEPNNPGVSSRIPNHFDYYFDIAMKPICGPEPLNEVCATVPHKPPSNRDLLYLIFFISEFGIFEKYMP